MEPLAVSVEQATEVTGTSRSVLYEEIKAGRLVARKLGRRTVIETAELRRWLASLATTGPDAA